MARSLKGTLGRHEIEAIPGDSQFGVSASKFGMADNFGWQPIRGPAGNQFKDVPPFGDLTYHMLEFAQTSQSYSRPFNQQISQAFSQSLSQTLSQPVSQTLSQQFV